MLRTKVLKYSSLLARVSLRAIVPSLCVLYSSRNPYSSLLVSFLLGDRSFTWKFRGTPARFWKSDGGHARAARGHRQLRCGLLRQARLPLLRGCRGGAQLRLHSLQEAAHRSLPRPPPAEDRKDLGAVRLDQRDVRGWLQRVRPARPFSSTPTDSLLFPFSSLCCSVRAASPLPPLPPVLLFLPSSSPSRPPLPFLTSVCRAQWHRALARREADAEERQVPADASIDNSSRHAPTHHVITRSSSSPSPFPSYLYAMRQCFPHPSPPHPCVDQPVAACLPNCACLTILSAPLPPQRVTVALCVCLQISTGKRFILTPVSDTCRHVSSALTKYHSARRSYYLMNASSVNTRRS